MLIDLLSYFVLQFSESRYLFGHFHLFSLLLSFLSILVTSVTFNDLESRGHELAPTCCPKGQIARLTVSFPFFLANLVFRSLGLALIICFMRFWSAIIIFMLVLLISQMVDSTNQVFLASKSSFQVLQYVCIIVKEKFTTLRAK